MSIPDSEARALSTLDARDQRILGALMEKQLTVPGSYPLSLNSLRTACNQTSSREPVSDYTEAELEEGLRSLRDRELVRFVWAGKGSRTVKYHQRLSEHLGSAEGELDQPARALLTVLLLRGAQSAGQLRSRCERLHPFADKEAVTATLQSMAERPVPLVQMLPRAAGHQDNRWIQLLGPVEGAPEAVSAAAPVDREGVLRDGPAARDAAVRSAHDAAAEAYQRAWEQRRAGEPGEDGQGDLSEQRGPRELGEDGQSGQAASGGPAALSEQAEPGGQVGPASPGNPFEHWLLTQVAARVRGPVADLGSGLGGATASLAAAGAEVTGIDFSPAMVTVARRLHPTLTFEVADFSRLLRPPTAAAWGGITAWYCLNHLAGSELAPIMESWVRVLAAGGVLALALHVGEESFLRGELLGVPVELEVVPHDPQQVIEAVEAAGLIIDEWYLRGPQPEQEHDPDLGTNRFCLVAHRP